MAKTRVKAKAKAGARGKVRTAGVGAGVVLAAVLATGAASPAGPAGPANPAAGPSGAADGTPALLGGLVGGGLDGQSARWMRASAVFAQAEGARKPRAVTHDPTLVPAGARVRVAQKVTGQGMEIEAEVHGVRPGHTYGVHVHTQPCGAAPDASGPHYQDRKDPKQPSTDPAYANRHNEVWLDLTTDDKGNGRASTSQKWHFRQGEARSLVLHEHATHTGRGEAGQAGDRVACFTAPFISGAR
ncbi:superoxide dismutase family protein [Streptomyces daliensis]|uniref:Superoxide dismutase family protein n=1 Tax=Streptomyces daliensis TaxID=299421 RepID=A0A8T4J6U7_9ACTN|nr:superoxide dismutase family protein [Streptomyces daliensis]